MHGVPSCVEVTFINIMSLISPLLLKASSQHFDLSTLTLQTRASSTILNCVIVALTSDTKYFDRSDKSALSKLNGRRDVGAFVLALRLLF